MKYTPILAILVLSTSLCLAADLPLKKLRVTLTPPKEAVQLSKERTKEKFFKGNPPHVAYEIHGKGATLTIRESVPLGGRMSLDELGEQLFTAVNKTTRDVKVLKRGAKVEEPVKFYELSYTDVSDNDIEMYRVSRLYVHEDIVVAAAFSVPRRWQAQFEKSLRDALDSIRFSRAQ